MTKRDLRCPGQEARQETETGRRQRRPAPDRAGSRAPSSAQRPRQSSALVNCVRKQYIFPKIWKDFAVAIKPATLMTANEAASVTGVPLRQGHRNIDAGPLGAAVKRRNKGRLLAPKGLDGPQ